MEDDKKRSSRAADTNKRADKKTGVADKMIRMQRPPHARSSPPEQKIWHGEAFAHEKYSHFPR